MKSANNFIRPPQEGYSPARPVEITKVYTMFLRKCRERFSFGGELHDPWEMVYIRKGEASITADDNIYHLSAGSVVFHKPMEFHQIFSDEPGLEIFVVSFNMEGDMEDKFHKAVFHLQDNEQALLEELIRQCVALNGGHLTDNDEWIDNPAWVDRSLDLYNCIHLLEYIFCLMLTRSPESQQRQKSADTMLYRKIVRILEEHIYTNITIDEVAHLCHVSASTAKTCFTRHAGCGLHKYYLKIKLRTAVRLLKEGKSVSEVSDTLSFNNPNYFSYVFRRETGNSPSYYK